MTSATLARASLTNLEIEQAVLGAFVMDNIAPDDTLSADDFTRYRDLFGTITSLDTATCLGPLSACLTTTNRLT